MFTLSKRTDYGLMALSYLALQAEGEATNAKAIAARYGIPAELLAKTMQLLARSGIVESKNGPKGGYVLARSPDSITIAEVVRAIEGPIVLATCQVGGGSECNQFLNCPILQPMERIQQKVTQLLEGMTLHEMVGAPVGEPK